MVILVLILPFVVIGVVAIFFIAFLTDRHHFTEKFDYQITKPVISPAIESWAKRKANEKMERREKKEKLELQARLEREELFKQKILAQQKVEDEHMNCYRQLRKEIEATPQYKHWRQGVLDKYGKKCILCGSGEKIEVDHRYQSFYAIIKRFGITNIVEAYECEALWDINNGAPLCRSHHELTKSHINNIKNAYKT
ncbi:MAG: hypothetical protein PHS79_03430 [Patescibacteria group bacterium]|nr:hypothetical protein [Patescibacteria group bacterium]